MVMDELQPLLDQSPPDPRTSTLLSLFCKSKKVQKMFRNSGKKFFSVAVGEHPGIYQSQYVQVQFVSHNIPTNIPTEMLP